MSQGFTTPLPTPLPISMGGTGQVSSTGTGLPVFQTSPEIITSINDMNGNIILGITPISSAVNYLSVLNTTTGVSPTLAATGSDSSIGLVLETKDGDVHLYDGTATKAPALIFLNAAATHYTGMAAVANQSVNNSFTLPTADGVANAPLITNGSGNWSFGGTFTDISGNVTVNGFSGTPTVTIRQCQIGNIVYLYFNITGTSNATTFTITGLPLGSTYFIDYPVIVENNGTIAFGVVLNTGSGSTTLTFQVGATGGAFTGSGTKAALGNIWYET